QADAGIPRGPLNDHAAGPERAALLGIAHDEQCRAVLDGAAGIEELGLAKDGAAGLLRGAAQLDERRIADGAEETVSYMDGDLCGVGARGSLGRQTTERARCDQAVQAWHGLWRLTARRRRSHTLALGSARRLPGKRKKGNGSHAILDIEAAERRGGRVGGR